jgi:hypothetical protein
MSHNSQSQSRKASLSVAFTFLLAVTTGYTSRYVEDVFSRVWSAPSEAPAATPSPANHLPLGWHRHQSHGLELVAKPGLPVSIQRLSNRPTPALTLDQAATALVNQTAQQLSDRCTLHHVSVPMMIGQHPGRRISFVCTPTTDKQPTVYLETALLRDLGDFLQVQVQFQQPQQRPDANQMLASIRLQNE